MDDASPDSKKTLSVVVIPITGSDGLSQCLQPLVGQFRTGSLEIILPHDDQFQAGREITRQFPGVRLLHLPGRHSYAELRAAGIASSMGAVVAITEDHCVPSTDWCEQITHLHNTHQVVGGAVEKAVPDRVLNWAIYLSDYVRYALPAEEGPATSLTDLNVSYQRSVLDSVNSLWAAEFHENQVHFGLIQKGIELWFSPRLIVSQKRTFTLSQAARDRYAFGRLFGSTRVAMASTSRRVGFIVTSFLIPVVQLWRIFGHVNRKRRYQKEFLLALPALLFTSVVWASGEFLGYVTGKPAK